MKIRHIINPSHTHEAAYKKPKSGKLKWVSCKAESMFEADKILDAHINLKYPNEGYKRYAGAMPIKGGLF